MLKWWNCSGTDGESGTVFVSKWERGNERTNKHEHNMDTFCEHFIENRMCRLHIGLAVFRKTTTKKEEEEREEEQERE